MVRYRKHRKKEFKRTPKKQKAAITLGSPTPAVIKTKSGHFVPGVVRHGPYEEYKEIYETTIKKSEDINFRLTANETILLNNYLEESHSSLKEWKKNFRDFILQWIKNYKCNRRKNGKLMRLYEDRDRTILYYSNPSGRRVACRKCYGHPYMLDYDPSTRQRTGKLYEAGQLLFTIQDRIKIQNFIQYHKIAWMDLVNLTFTEYMLRYASRIRRKRWAEDSVIDHWNDIQDILNTVRAIKDKSSDTLLYSPDPLQTSDNRQVDEQVEPQPVQLNNPYLNDINETNGYIYND